jgi:hypothetical protein
MPLYDLLWACPVCGEDRGLIQDDETCTGCATRFLRGAGASIRAVNPDGSVETRSPAEWLDRLPAPAALLQHDPVRVAHVLIQPVTGDVNVSDKTGFLNRIEVFGDERPGEVQLEADGLRVAGEWWGLETLTAVQTSSKSLQIKRSGQPLVSFRFRDDSVFLWEQLLRAALRDFYGRTGRGEIREFQPRIVAR